MSTPSAKQFFEQLEAGKLRAADARSQLSKLDSQLSSDEKAKALATISQLEMAELSKPEEPASKSLVELLPDGWLRDYVLFQQVSEAPDTFHLFSALVMLSHILGRKISYRVGASIIFAPISVFLVSPAGQARRSSAINAAVEVARSAQTTIIQDTMTPEGLLHWLRDQGHALIVGDEAASLLSKSSYQEVMPQILCRLLDCPPKFERTMKSDTFEIEKPTVSILMGCAPEWILTSMPRSALGGGLFSRMIVVRETEVKRLVPRPEVEIDNKTMVDGLADLSQKLIDLASHPGGLMRYNERAGKRFDDFYRSNYEAGKDVDERMAVYLSRKPTHVHRLCMSFLISAGRRELEVDENTLDVVLGVLAGIESGMIVAYSMGGLEVHGQMQQRILNKIDRCGGQIKHSDLLRFLSCSTMEMEAAIVSLTEGGVLDIKEAKIKGHPMKLYVRKPRRREES